jgi:hypothetical protein
MHATKAQKNDFMFARRVHREGAVTRQPGRLCSPNHPVRAIKPSQKIIQKLVRNP